MFEELVRTAIVPLVTRLAAPPAPGGTVREAVETLAGTFIREVASTRRGDIIRLIVSEGPRFPAIADFYYREVISRGLAGIRALIELGIAGGEIRQTDLARFPQILVAPAIIAVIWKSLFERHSPLDAHEMLRVHLDLPGRLRRTRSQPSDRRRRWRRVCWRDGRRRSDPRPDDVHPTRRLAVALRQRAAHCRRVEPLQQHVDRMRRRVPHCVQLEHRLQGQDAPLAATDHALALLEAMEDRSELTPPYNAVRPILGRKSPTATPMS